MIIYPPNGGEEIVLKGNSFPFAIDFERKQNFGEAENGKIRVYDRGVESQFIHVSIKNMLPDMQRALEDFIRNKAVYRLHTFFFEDETTNPPIGKTRVRFWGDRFSRNLVNFNLFDVDFVLKVEEPGQRI